MQSPAETLHNTRSSHTSKLLRALQLPRGVLQTITELCILFLTRSSSLHSADLINSLPPFQESLNRVSQEVAI